MLLELAAISLAVGNTILVPQWVLAGLGVILVPFVAWCIRLSWNQATVGRQITHLVWMHENADKTKFGTVGLKEALVNNTRATNALIYYIRWLAKQAGHGEPPPFIDDPAP